MNDHDVVYKVRCPKCNAPAGVKCKTKTGNKREISHAERCQVLGINVLGINMTPTVKKSLTAEYVLSVPCPHCKAGINVPCIDSKEYDLPVAKSHQARIRDMILKRHYETNDNYKRIGYTIVSQNDKKVTFRISTQTHRQNLFGKKGTAIFDASNGILLKSGLLPEWQPHNKSLYVRGHHNFYDGEEITVDLKTFEEIKFAMNEYNDYFSDKSTSENETHEDTCDGKSLESSQEDELKKRIGQILDTPEGIDSLTKIILKHKLGDKLQEQIEEDGTKENNEEGYFFVFDDPQMALPLSLPMTKEKAIERLKTMHDDSYDMSKLTVIKGTIVQPRISFDL